MRGAFESMEAVAVLEAGTFEGVPVMRVQVAGEPYVVVRPLVAHLGLDWGAQLGRIVEERLLQHGGRACRWVSQWVRFPRAVAPGQLPYRIEAAIRERDLPAWVQSARGEEA